MLLRHFLIRKIFKTVFCNTQDFCFQSDIVSEEEQVQRNHPQHREETAGELPEQLPQEDTHQESPLLQAGIEELGLSVRSENSLHRAGIETIGQLVAKTENELRLIRNFGQKCLSEVTAKMAEKNLFLRKAENGEQT